MTTSITHPQFTKAQIGVIVVEDEPVLLFNACELLTDAGLFAFAAANADEAVAILHKRRDIQVLITDVSLSDSAMDGWQLVRLVATTWPHIGQLVVSGGAPPDPSDLLCGVRFMQKPYRSYELISQVSQLVSERIASN